MKLWIALFVLLAASCSSSRYFGARYGPSPVETELSASAVQGAQARALATVLGIAKPADGAPAQVEIRVRLENLGAVAVDLDPASFSLLSADLETFGAPRLTPAGGASIAPGAAHSVDLAFPLPPGKTQDDYNWSGLNLKLAVSFAGTRVTASIPFSRVEYVPAYEPRMHVGFGFWHDG